LRSELCVSSDVVAQGAGSWVAERAVVRCLPLRTQAVPWSLGLCGRCDPSPAKGEGSADRRSGGAVSGEGLVWSFVARGGAMLVAGGWLGDR